MFYYNIMEDNESDCDWPDDAMDDDNQWGDDNQS